MLPFDFAKNFLGTACVTGVCGFDLVRSPDEEAKDCIDTVVETCE